MTRISYNHPRFNDIQREASDRFNRDFNEVSVDSAERVAKTCLFDFISSPSFRVLADEWLGDQDGEAICLEFLNSEAEKPDPEDLANDAVSMGRAMITEHENPLGEMYYHWVLDGETSDEAFSDSASAHDALGELLLEEWLKHGFTDLAKRMDKEGVDNDVLEAVNLDGDDFYNWLESEYEDDINQHFEEQGWYPMWGTLFEAKDRFLSRKILDNVDELYDCGIGVIESLGDFGPMLFIAGAGYDFYEAHWIPLYRLFGWLDINKYPDPDKKLTGCNSCGNEQFSYPVEMRVRPFVGEAGDHLLSPPTPYVSKYDRPKVLRCTNCGAEHAESNFNWVEER